MSEVSLRNQNLATLSENIINENAETCVKLDLTENAFTDFSWLPKFKALKTLILDNNNLRNIKNIPQCPTVDTLWLNNNRISDLRTLMDCVARLFPNLTYLSVLKNPCTPDMYFAEDEGEAYQRFRYYVIHRLPTLNMLDATPVDDEEMSKAQSVGHLMSPARPVDDDHDDHDEPVQAYSVTHLVKNATKPKVSSFLVRSKPRYDGSNSEGNRFITNDDL